MRRTTRPGRPGSPTPPATRNRPGCASQISSNLSVWRSRPPVKMPVATPSSSIRARSPFDVERPLVAAEVAGDVRVLGLPEERGRRLIGHQVDPDVDDVHARSPCGRSDAKLRSAAQSFERGQRLGGCGHGRDLAGDRLRGARGRRDRRGAPRPQVRSASARSDSPARSDRPAPAATTRSALFHWSAPCGNHEQRQTVGERAERRAGSAVGDHEIAARQELVLRDPAVDRHVGAVAARGRRDRSCARPSRRCRRPRRRARRGSAGRARDHGSRRCPS